MLCAGAAVLGLAAGAIGAQERADATPSTASARMPPVAALTGLWDYNADESVIAANGRPEQAPVSATQRGAGPPPRRSGGSRTGDAFPGMRGGRSGRRGSGGPDVGPTEADLVERRGLVRDLLEVPERLTIDASLEAVTFTDDLGRALTFPATGRKHEYQLSGSRFDVRALWDGGQFRKEIEGVAGFKMTETYFLSEDRQRLFVVIRVGEQPEDGPPNGINRVYDRIAAPSEP
jgi:hypothetical protein